MPNKRVEHKKNAAFTLLIERHEKDLIEKISKRSGKSYAKLIPEIIIPYGLAEGFITEEDVISAVEADPRATDWDAKRILRSVEESVGK